MEPKIKEITYEQQLPPLSDGQVLFADNLEAMEAGIMNGIAAINSIATGALALTTGEIDTICKNL